MADRGDGDSPTYRQVVTAVRGAAYGVQGADIHVYGDGTPAYLLENHKPADRLEPADERYTEALEALRAWQEESSTLCVRWLRITEEATASDMLGAFADCSARRRWRVVVARLGTQSAVPALATHDVGSHGHVGTLLMVPSADGWPHSHLCWLLSNSLIRQRRTPVRVLLTGANREMWDELRANLIKLQANTSYWGVTGPHRPFDGPRRARRDRPCSS